MAFRNALPLVTTIFAVLLLTEGARADCTSQTIGSTTFHYCDDGASGTSQRLGDTTFHYFDGESGTSQKLGDTVFYHLDGRSGTSQQIGDTSFHHLDGVSGTSQRLGRTTFHHFDDGTSGTSQRLGGTTFLHLQPGRSPEAGRIPLLEAGREKPASRGLFRQPPGPAPHPPPFRVPSLRGNDEGPRAPFPVFSTSVGAGSNEADGADPFALDLWD